MQILQLGADFVEMDDIAHIGLISVNQPCLIQIDDGAAS